MKVSLSPSRKVALLFDFRGTTEANLVKASTAHMAMWYSCGCSLFLRSLMRTRSIWYSKLGLGVMYELQPVRSVFTSVCASTQPLASC